MSVIADVVAAPAAPDASVRQHSHHRRADVEAGGGFSSTL